MSSSKILVISYDNPFIPHRDMEAQQNVGNYVFINSVSSYFYSKDINSTFITHEELVSILDNDKHWVNDHFDKVVVTEANIVDVKQLHVVDRLIKIASCIKKPIYLIGVGAQSSIDYSFDFLPAVAEKIKKLANLIYSGGGKYLFEGNLLKKYLIG